MFVEPFVEGLYVVDMDFGEHQELPDGCQINAWRPNLPGISEVFHARIVDYGYPSHCHSTWTVLIVDAGAISYALDKRSCGAVGDTIAILPPGVTHDGRPAPGAGGFTKRVLYLDESVLPFRLVGAAVERTNIDDRELRQALVALHVQLCVDADPFHGESLLALIADRLVERLESATPVRRGPEPTVALKLRELLDASLTSPVTLSDAATQLQRSKSHLIRSFSGTYGVAPHAYLIGRRVEAARKLLLGGVQPADAALAVGFYDQAHLSRHFKRHTSVPPATYARCSFGV